MRAEDDDRAGMGEETNEPKPGTSEWYATLATPKQMNWVLKLPGGEQAALERFGVPVGRLTKAQAAELIKEHDLRKGGNV